MSITSTAMRPRMGKIAQAVTYSGRSRSRLYQLSAEYPSARMVRRLSSTSTSLIAFSTPSRPLRPNQPSKQLPRCRGSISRTAARKGPPLRVSVTHGAGKRRIIGEMQCPPI
jgi:hypothetical protein